MSNSSKFYNNRFRWRSFLLLLILVFSFFVISPKATKAQTADINQGISNTVLNPLWDFIKKAYEKGGAAALQQATRTALNKIAYDTANWIGSGREGQKPLFVTQGWGDYLSQIGDEAAGQFLETAVANWQNASWTSDAKGTEKNEQCKLAYDDCIGDRDYSKCVRSCGINNPASCTDTCRVSFPKKTMAQCEAQLFQCSGVDTGSDGVTSSRLPASSLATLVCRPSSLDARLKISLALVDYQRPKAPNCSASQMVERWDDEYYRQTEIYTDPHFFTNMRDLFNPASNDLGIYYTLRANSQSIINSEEDKAKTTLESNKGWLDVRNIAGNIVGTPGDAERKIEMSEQGYINNIGEFTGDALIDAANVFLNQLAVSFFNKKMSNLGKIATSGDDNNIYSDPNIRYGEGKVRESMAEIIEPNFGTRGDYNILVALSTCRDRNNPGPTDCVIDERFMQGVTEKKTVAEAVKEGYLRSDWQFTSEYRDGTYNLRNIQILRKYRIVPTSWEIAAQYNQNATLLDLMSCFSASDKYTSYSSNFNILNQSWCRGLVDPNWVLKAPLNYCSAQGYSSQILNVSVIPSVSDNAAISDTVTVVRADNYCGDDQSCIDENPDGSCETYGHCLSERRTWNFNSPSCDPINNTCSSFVSASSGAKVSYLENTLDYGDCTADSVGCQRYSTNGSYDVDSGQVTWSANPFANAYFNDKLESCSSDSESCQEMMRVKSAWGSNLVMGADFSNDNIGDVAVESRINNYWSFWSNGTRSAEIIDTSSLDGISLGKAIRASSTSEVISLYSNNAVSLLPADFNVISDETYTLSADVYLITGDRVHVILGDDYTAAVQTTDQQVWRHLSVTRDLREKPLSELSFGITAYSDNGPTEFAVRNVKLEMSSFDSGFSAYGSQKIYEKLIPNYLKDTCYQDANSSSPDYRLKIDAPAVCSNFARQCNMDEAGCERFSELSSGFSVAAQAVTTDYCDSSCNGYDLYVSRANYFYSPQAEKIIPQNSQTCSAQAVGCSEFTNLDDAAMGGENREYYVQLKQCIKPGADCADFYTWVGTEESGYQLKSFVLKKDESGNPAATSDGSAYCNESIFNLPPSDPFFNPDCRQYYNKAGQISYRLNSSTITCSENCHSYRLTENNIDTTVSQAECVGTDRSWNSTISSCYVCKNGGLWNNEQQACLYQAIPQEGTKCSAQENGCREYNGNLGNNTRLISSNSFAFGLEGWEGQCGDAAVHSPVANSNNGQSLMYDRGANAGGVQQQTNCDQSNQTGWLDRIMGSANAAPSSFIRKILGNSVSESKAYSLKFTASAANNTNVYVGFLNSKDEMVYFNASESNSNGSFVINGNNEWQTYEINLPVLDHQVDANESLVIVASADFYLDNLVLTEISNRYYLIKNTSQIPDICYYDMLDNYQGPDYNLGCSAYTDRANTVHYLRQFNKLCQDSAVGCEMMISTANFDNFKGNIWKDTNDNGLCDSNEPECIKVAGDKFTYAIYDKTKQCNVADLGCSRFGEAISSAENLAWSDVFKRNNPNKYDSIICSALDSGCEAWQYLDGTGTAYFKNPANNTCVYRNSTDPEKVGKAWYKSPVMRCDLNNNGNIDGIEKGTKICASATDCAANRPCVIDNNDYECPVSYFKTFGYGGGGQQIPIPSESAAICEASQSSCTEYIDPVSSFSVNLVKDPSADQNNNAWDGTGANASQRVDVEPNSLYIISVNTANPALVYDVRVESPIGLSQLQEDNSLSSELINSFVIPRDNPSQRYIFHSRNNKWVRVFGPNANHEIVLKKAIIDYQLESNVDKTTCNGLVNEADGCILFNERSMNGGQGLLSLSGGWNAAASQDGQAPQVCTTGNCDSNTLIKVRPDRTCASWLDCMTYVVDADTGERTCYALGECNALNDQGECMNFVAPDNSIVNAASSDLTKLSGYSVLDKYSLARMKEVGSNTTAHFNFEAASPTLYCQKIGTSSPCVFTSSIQAESIINSPSNAPADYPAEGGAYLRVMSGQMISPHSVNSPIVLPNNSLTNRTTHYINFLLNTKDTGVQARVSVYEYSAQSDYYNQTPLKTQIFSANQGWERKVMSFNVAADNDKVVLMLSVENGSRTEERYVYFDDINIEPVLEVGNNEYVAKECRLYPSQDALSCSSVNSKVVKDGLVGYCLQHDSANKNVCLLWYPVDEISANFKSARSTLGYQGAFPLNYCTEANGNFTLVEKRVAKLVDSEKENSAGNDSLSCFYEDGSTSNFCTVNNGTNDDTNNEPELHNKCQPDRSSNFDYFILQFRGWDRKDTFCIPLNNDRLATTIDPLSITTSHKDSGTQSFDFSFDVSDYNGWYIYDGFSSRTDSTLNEAKNANPSVRIFDRTVYNNNQTIDEDDLKLISSPDSEKVYYPTCNKFVQVVDNDGNNKAWADRVSKNSAYLFDTPAFFRDVNTFYGSIPDTCHITEYNCTDECACDNGCNCFTEPAHCQPPCGFIGDCLAWEAVQTPVDCSTPGAIHTISVNNYDFTKYGRNRELVPFGAATFPDNFNIFASEAVKFRNQYSSKIDQEAFAGRPYGCSGPGCSNLGYCSLDPNVYCILDYTDSANKSLVNQRSCGAANGTCVPMWNGGKVADQNSLTPFLSDNILKNTFLTSYDGYTFSKGKGTYESAYGYIDINNNIPVNYIDSITQNGACLNLTCHASTNDSSFNTYWHYVLPIISQVKINSVPVSGNSINVQSPGIYKLSFNTTIDKEQQPLRDLIVNWGDGNIQNLVNQDSRPNITDPHVVYHYYATVGIKNFSIRVTDNWSLYRVWP